MKRGLEPRRPPFRGARLFVIAVEGEKTERWYFRGLESAGIVSGRRVRLRVLPSTDGGPSPAQVAERLHDVMASEPLKEIDQRWFVVDVDRRPGLDGVIKGVIEEGVRSQ